jgi:hypothetical protein
VTTCCDGSSNAPAVDGDTDGERNLIIEDGVLLPAFERREIRDEASAVRTAKEDVTSVSSPGLGLHTWSTASSGSRWCCSRMAT